MLKIQVATPYFELSISIILIPLELFAVLKVTFLNGKPLGIFSIIIDAIVLPFNLDLITPESIFAPVSGFTIIMFGAD